MQMMSVKNLVVIETTDAILVVDKKESQKIKEIVNHLNIKEYAEAKEHKKVYRPWGSYKCLFEEPTWKVKKIIVNLT